MRRHGSRLWYLLLTLPFAGLLYPPLYSRADPELFGFPFFYWYQFAWVPISALLTWVVYLKTRPRESSPADRPGDGRFARGEPQT
jgi:hypothetical protein